MCDLIDLNSPDPRKLTALSKLASPLIPGPSTPANDKQKVRCMDFVTQGKRSSPDNNPFDKVLKETAEYVAKKDDPFEAVLEKALRPSSGWNEDSTPRRKKHSAVLRMNKTMDEPLLQGILNKNLNQLIKMTKLRDGVDLSKTEALNYKDLEDRNGLQSPSICVFPPSPGDCSVLNQSAMNDSLSEVGEGICDINLLTNPSKHRRSLSQTTTNSPQSSQFRPRSKSIAETLKVVDSQSKSRGSSVSSGVSDLVNNAFMEAGSSVASTSKSFDISAISPSASSMNSDSSKNRAFILDSQLSGRIFGSCSSTKSSLNLSRVSRHTGAGNYSVKTPLKTPVRIADLELKLEKLKRESSNYGVTGLLPSFSPNHKVENFLGSGRVENGDDKKIENNSGKDAKLIDTESFVATNEGEDFNPGKTDSLSNCSSDSVFVESEKVEKSVFREAKLLARTFDELALQSTSASFSSGDDLLYSRPRWNFDVLPPSDDEDGVVDNLIELPVSPLKKKGDIDPNPKEEEAELPESKVSDEIRELETQFIDQDVARNKVMAATLLLDLEKIVHRENNPEAITLLENLEKVLGVKYESNAQLLATCMQWTNNLSKSPKKCIKKLGSVENIKHDSLEKSHEDNNDAVLSNEKMLKICNDENLGLNLNVEKAINKSEKSIIADLTPAAEEEKEDLPDESKNDSKVLENGEKEIVVDQTEALELITNLSKILGGSKNESSPLSLLTNLRQVLNLATNQLNFENSQITKSQTQGSPSEVETGNAVPQKKHPIKPKVDPIKSGRKASVEPLIKAQINLRSSAKRSVSLGSVQRNTVPGLTAAKEKTKPHSKSIKKALSCDAVPKPDTQKNSSSITGEGSKSRVSAIGVTGKYKLKKKLDSEGVTAKKGPLKALLPVGNMQRRGSMISRAAPISLSRTPPKSNSESPCTFTSATSSTPNPTVSLIASKKSPKTKPVASSTPDGAGSKTRKMRLHFSGSNSKPKFSCNISPVAPPPPQSITGSAGSKGLPKNYRRHNKTLSPPKQRGSHEAQALNTTESCIPKYSPLVGFSRRNSKENVKTLNNSASPKTSFAKTQTPKKSPAVNNSGSQIPQSPLKAVNNQNSKFKPFNLISKLRRSSNSSNVMDKENCA